MKDTNTITLNLDNLNSLALEITKIMVNKVIDENTPAMEVTAIFLKNYSDVVSSIAEIKSNPEMLNEK